MLIKQKIIDFGIHNAIIRTLITGAVAQLGEHLLCKQGVARSNRVSSTKP